MSDSVFTQIEIGLRFWKLDFPSFLLVPIWLWVFCNNEVDLDDQMLRRSLKTEKLILHNIGLVEV